MDGGQVRQAALQVAAVAEESRALAGRVGAAAGVEWRGPAAARFAEHLAAERRSLERCAAAVDDAAASLLAHAAALERWPTPALPGLGVPGLGVPGLGSVPGLSWRAG